MNSIHIEKNKTLPKFNNIYKEQHKITMSRCVSVNK